MAYASKEKAREAKRAWYAKHREDEAARRKRARQQHPGREAAAQREHYRKNPDAQRAASDRWRDAHPEAWRDAEWRRWLRRQYGRIPDDAEIARLELRRRFNVEYRGFAGRVRLVKP